MREKEKRESVKTKRNNFTTKETEREGESRRSKKREE